MNNADQIYKPGFNPTKKASKANTIQQVRELLAGSSAEVILISIDQSTTIKAVCKGNGNAVGLGNTVTSPIDDKATDLKMQVLFLKMKMDLLQMNATNYEETKQRLTILLDSQISSN